MGMPLAAPGGRPGICVHTTEGQSPAAVDQDVELREKRCLEE